MMVLQSCWPNLQGPLLHFWMAVDQWAEVEVVEAEAVVELLVGAGTEWASLKSGEFLLEGEVLEGLVLEGDKGRGSKGGG